MTLSGSFDIAHAMALCQFCEESTEVKWNCINCELSLCQLCNCRIHSKIKFPLPHKILKVGKCETNDAIEAIRRVYLKDISCVRHNDRKCEVFCDDCDEQVCSECIIELHKHHELKTLESVYETSLCRLKSLKDKSVGDLNFWKNEHDKIESCLEYSNKDFENIQKNIIQQREIIVNRIHKYSENLLTKVEKEWKTNVNDIQEKLTITTKCYVDVKRENQRLASVLQSRKASEILNERSSRGEILPEKIEYQSDVKTSKFVHGKMTDDDLCKIFGELCPVDAPTFELLHSTEMTGFFRINKLKCVDDFFFAPSFSSFLTQFRLKDEKVTEKSVININLSKTDVYDRIADFDIMHNGDILISVGREDLFIYSADGKRQKLHSFLFYTTAAVHVNKHQQIIVGLINHTDNKKQGKISILTTDGKCEQTIDGVEETEVVFTKPIRIQTNDFNDLCIIDEINSESAGRVVTLNEKGKLKWIYTGHKQNNSKSNVFTPVDMVITQHDLVLISDINNHAIHVLNPCGKLVICKSLLDENLLFPYGIDTDASGKLWILTTVKFFPCGKQALHEVKFV